MSNSIRKVILDHYQYWRVFHPLFILLVIICFLINHSHIVAKFNTHLWERKALFSWFWWNSKRSNNHIVEIFNNLGSAWPSNCSKVSSKVHQHWLQSNSHCWDGWHMTNLPLLALIGFCKPYLHVYFQNLLHVVLISCSKWSTNPWNYVQISNINWISQWDYVLWRNCRILWNSTLQVPIITSAWTSTRSRPMWIWHTSKKNSQKLLLCVKPHSILW
jgi:hypothetical protein